MVMHEEFMSLQKRLGHMWADQDLLHRAFMHTSWCNEHPSKPEPNERLEFLGDSVLDLLSAEYLMVTMPEAREGLLSQARAGRVKKQALAYCAVGVGLGMFLLVGRRGESLRFTEGVLADLMEAVIGSAYLDGGLDAARNVVMAARVLG